MKVYSNFVLFITLLLGLTFSALLARSFYTLETKSIRTTFEKSVDDQSATIERELTLNFETLYAIKGLFDSSEHVTPEMFNQLAAEIIIRHKNIQALEWVPKVSHEQRGLFETNGRKRFPDFLIIEQNEQALMVQAKTRKEYFPVYYVEPYLGNEAALGFDLASNSNRLTALNLARQSGNLVISPSVSLVQDASEKKGFLAILPIYQGQPSTVKQRDEKLIGFIVGVFKIYELIENSNLPTLLSGIDFVLQDETATPPELLYGKPLSVDDMFMDYKRHLDSVGGREWSIVAQPSQQYISEHRSSTPLVIFLLAIVFIFFGTAYTFLLFRYKQELERTTLIDGLTGVANRRHFNIYLAQEWARALRDSHTLSLIMIDIDHFKQFNDHYGHLAGDSCLKSVAKILDNTLQRATDLVARYGGEEFAIILPNNEDPHLLAELCRKNVAKAAISHSSSPVADHVTISLGISTMIPSPDLQIQDLIETADQALYKAKNSGRNKTSA